MMRMFLVCAIIVSIPLSAWSQDLLYDQSATGQYTFVQCMHDSVYPFTTKLCDNFSLGMEAVIDSVVWWGGYWSYPVNPLVDFTIEVFEDSTGQLHPYQEPFYSQRVDFFEEDLGGYYKYSALMPPCTVSADQNYYICFMASIVFPPHWGNNCSWPGQSPGWGDGNEAFFKSDLFGYDEWTPISSVNGDPFESSFQLFSLSVAIDEYLDIHRSVDSPLFVFPTACTHADRILISYTVSHPCLIDLEIYNSAGQCVRTLVSEQQTPGEKYVRWDLLDNGSCTVSQGMYFIRLLSDVYSETSKIVIIE
jgi:hypothetical protein